MTTLRTPAAVVLSAFVVLSMTLMPGIVHAQTAAGGTERTQSAQAKQADARKLETLVRQSGLKFEKRRDGSWTVSFKGDVASVIDVNVKSYDGLVLVQAIVATENPTLTAETLSKLLGLSFEVDLAKVAIDDSGDVVAMHEAILRTLDADAFKEIVNAVASFADDLVDALPESGTAVPVSRASDLTRSTEGSYTVVEGLLGHVVVRYDPSEWRQMKTDEPGISQFQHRAGDAYIRFIHERISIPLDKLPSVALSNSKAADPSAKVTRSGERLVNGVRVLFQEWHASVNGVPLILYGHFFSDPSGSVQIIGWTGPGLMDEVRPKIEKFVAEFEVRPK